MYDLIIIGAGPAGLTTSIYASRYKIKHLVIGRLLGGLAGQAHLIENYPGCRTASGKELMDKFFEHARSYAAEILEDEVVDIIKHDVNLRTHANATNKIFEIRTNSGKSFRAKTIILALGTERKKLNISGEKEFWGKGVTYCATCDAPLYKNKIVAVIGGGNAALTAALLLADYAKQVYLIHRRDKYSADLSWQEKVLADKRIEKIYNTNLKEIKGDQVVKEIILVPTSIPHQPALSSRKFEFKLKVDGLFIEIGSSPVNELSQKLGLNLDEKGYIKVDRDCRTNINGVFAAGDATNYTDLKQILTAASQGAIAAFSVYKYISNLTRDSY